MKKIVLFITYLGSAHAICDETTHPSSTETQSILEEPATNPSLAETQCDETTYPSLTETQSILEEPATNPSLAETQCDETTTPSLTETQSILEEPATNPPLAETQCDETTTPSLTETQSILEEPATNPPLAETQCDETTTPSLTETQSILEEPATNPSLAETQCDETTTPSLTETQSILEESATNPSLAETQCDETTTPSLTETQSILEEPATKTNRVGNKTRGVNIEIKAGYFIFGDHTMRKVFDQGGEDVQLCCSYPMWEMWSLNLYGSIEYLQRHGKSLNGHQRTRIEELPLTLGIKPFFSVSPAIDYYFILGPRYTFVWVTNHSSYVDKHMYKSGFGGFVGTGFIFYLPRHWTLDLFGEYSYTHLHFHSSKHNSIGETRQIGGFTFGLGLGYQL